MKDLFPLCKTDDILAGFYVAEDGRVNPVDATMSLARGARMHGATIIEGVQVDSVTETVVAGQRYVSGVKTSTGIVLVSIQSIPSITITITFTFTLSPRACD